MKRLLPLAALIPLATGCGRTDVFVAWTIDSEDPATACALYGKSSVRIHMAQRNEIDSQPVDEDVEFSCKAASGIVQVAPYSALKAELFTDAGSFGFSSPVAVEPGVNERFSGQTSAEPLVFNIRPDAGTLVAHLTVVGQSCGDAGVDAFTLTLYSRPSALDDAIVVDDAVEVPCKDGDATYTKSALDVGTHYFIVATAGDTHATEGGLGEGVILEGAVTETDVDLRPVP